MWSYLASVDAEKCSLWTLADKEVFVTTEMQHDWISPEELKF